MLKFNGECAGFEFIEWGHLFGLQFQTILTRIVTFIKKVKLLFVFHRFFPFQLSIIQKLLSV